jgi:cytoskeletal protein RodZ
MRGGIDDMTTDNGFQPERPPIFLSERMDETVHADIETGWNVATVSSRIFKASALAAAVTTIGVGALSLGNPVALVANVTDWWNDKPVLQLEADTSASTMPTTADAQDAAATTDEPAREEVAVAAAPADPNRVETVQRRAQPVQLQPVQAPSVQVQSLQVQAEPPRPAEVAPNQTEKGPPVSAELFRQFQAWAAEDEARARAGAPAAPARVAQETQPARPAKRQRRAQSVQNARAEVRPQRHHRPRVREEQDGREPIAPAVDARAPDPTAQNAQPPSFFQSLGFR